jgi:glutathione S-transferase
MNRTLYHFKLCPFSRRIRIHLAEKKLEFDLIDEPFWERRQAFARINPAMEVPALAEANGKVFCESHAISEYIENAYPEPRLLGTGVEGAAEVRRLMYWCDIKLYNEVTRYLLNEKVLRYLVGGGAPASDAIHAANHNLKEHIRYFEYLLKERRWLAGNEFSLSDVALAAHVSVIDYLSAMRWDNTPSLKHWYSLVKSRPSFRDLLGDRLSGFAPPVHYANLDF